MLDPAVRPIRPRRSRRDLWCRFDLDENGRAALAGKRQRTGSPLFVSPLPCRQRPALSGRLEWKERGNEIAPLGERVSRLALRLLEAMRMHRSPGRRSGAGGIRATPVAERSPRAARVGGLSPLLGRDPPR